MDNNAERQKIIEALDYPRLLMQNEIDLPECTHSGNYDQEDICCRQCDSELECQWLCSNDGCVAFDQKSLEVLKNSLEFAFCYVDGLVSRYEHDKRKCSCEACRWSRAAWRLLDSKR